MNTLYQNVVVQACCLALLHALAYDIVLATHLRMPLLTGIYLMAFTCVFTPDKAALFWQMRLPWKPEDASFPTLPMALLTAVVRKEAQLPEHTTSLAATQLLPVVLAATKRHLASTSGRPPRVHVSEELLVRAKLGSHRCCWRHRCSMWIPALKCFKRREHDLQITCRPLSALHGSVEQVMCSYLATSSALPVLLGHRELIMLAADMVHASRNTGWLPTSSLNCQSFSLQVCNMITCAPVRNPSSFVTLR